VLVNRADGIWATRRVAEARAAFTKLLEVTCPTARECRDHARQGKYRALLEGQRFHGLDDMWNLDQLLMLAERAVQLDPTDWRNYQLLGMAQYRDEQFAVAAETFQTESQSRGGTLSARSLFFLASTHQRLHETAQAKDCYEKARQWWQTTFPRLPASRQAELVPVRHETEQVLWRGVTNTQENVEKSSQVDRIWTLCAQGKSLTKANRLDEALAAFGQVIGMVGADTNLFTEPLVEARLYRSAVLRRLNRLTDAGVENCLARGIPLRDPQTRSEFLDLSLFYNAALTRDMQDIQIRPGARNDLAALPRGVQRLGPVEFDVRGLINLSGTFLSRSQMRRFPSAVTGIPLHRKVARLHCLHGTVWLVPHGTPVGSYRLRFADGREQVFPVIYGVDVRDWHRFPSHDSQAEKVVVAWEGANPASSLNRGIVQLTRSTFENPRPDVEVTSLDFVSAMTDCAPFLIALTLDTMDTTRKVE
jgi:tetratricopeptide (TPR) repeat protein